MTLIVQAPPTVTIQYESEPYYTTPGEIFRIYSNITGSPEPNITWSFTNYPNFPSDKKSFSNILFNYENRFIDKHIQRSHLTMSTNISGRLTCIACNLLNCNKSSKLIISDRVGRFGIIGPKEKVYLGDDVALTCTGSIYAFRNLSWNVKFDECYKNVYCQMFYIEEDSTQYMIRRVLHMKNVTECHRRSYLCSGQKKDTNIEKSSYHLNLTVPMKPHLHAINLYETKRRNFDLKENYTKTHFLKCCANGDPLPNFTWFKDKLELKKGPEYDILPNDCGSTLYLCSRREKAGRYTCRATNRFGQVEDYIGFISRVDGKTYDMKSLIAIVACIFISIFLVVAWLVIQKRCMKALKRRLQKEILTRFDAGTLDHLNPNLDLTDQAEVLPYDDNWEYPRNQLELGKILGKGVFGIVRKAQAKAICPDEPFSTVAVKTVGMTSKLHQMIALSRELKILVYLGQHMNIVNLLGACTKKVSYGELFVIVEFCKFGNLQDYLSYRRADFIDQINPMTGEINDPNLSTDHVSINDDGGTVDCHDDSVIESDCHGSRDSMCSNLKDDVEISFKISVESGLRSKYEGDYADSILEPLRTKDLLCWARQVSRGMRYLGTRRALYKDDHYMEEGGGPMPIKWMAVEAIRDGRFSVESDIWSFGVFSWELFTLGQSPYPGVHLKYVYQKLLEGHRMDKPKYAPIVMYRLMMDCWEAEPAGRPTFGKMENVIHELLDDSVTAYYLDLSNQYTEMNAQILGNGKKDYLTIDPSQYKAISSSVESEEVELSNIQTDKSSKPLNPKTSFVIQDRESSSNSDYIMFFSLEQI